jgi:uncharacterized membrane protein YbaN (DUF454 family)
MAAFAWKVVATVALVLAALAVALPVLPALPFLLVAALAAERGWPWLGDRLAEHASLGPAVRAWKERGAIPSSVKVVGLVGLAISAAGAWAWPGSLWLPVCVDAALLAAGAWLWTRPVA